jgi:transcriptional regulator with XRE-family HTH domain
MTAAPDDHRAQPGQEFRTGLSVPRLLAAIQKTAEKEGLDLSEVAQRSGVGDLLERMEAGLVHDEQLFIRDLAALGQALGVSTSELSAAADALARKGEEL